MKVNLPLVINPLAGKRCLTVCTKSINAGDRQLPNFMFYFEVFYDLNVMVEGGCSNNSTC